MDQKSAIQYAQQIFEKTPKRDQFGDLSRDKLRAWRKEREEILDKMDDQAREDGTLVGRYYKTQRGDGYAHYIVLAADEEEAKLYPVCMIDMWFDPVVEDLDRVVPREIVEKNVARRDSRREHMDSLEPID